MEMDAESTTTPNWEQKYWVIDSSSAFEIAANGQMSSQ